MLMAMRLIVASHQCLNTVNLNQYIVNFNGNVNKTVYIVIWHLWIPKKSIKVKTSTLMCFVIILLMINCLNSSTYLAYILTTFNVLLFNTPNKVRGSTTIETGPGIFCSVLSMLSFYITRMHIHSILMVYKTKLMGEFPSLTHIPRDIYLHLWKYMSTREFIFPLIPPPPYACVSSSDDLFSSYKIPNFDVFLFNKSNPGKKSKSLQLTH